MIYSLTGKILKKTLDTVVISCAGVGYAVQVPDASRPAGYRLVAVRVGTITDDYAAVTGTGVDAGLEVVVPS